jgi:copper homeostasis protein CutC
VSVEEHCELIKATVEHAKGRIPIIAGAGANSTAEAIKLTRYAKEAGADATCKWCRTTTVLPRKACTSTSRPSPKRWTCR